MERRQDKVKNGPKRAEDIKYCRALKEFLQTFKTEKCAIDSEHRLESCRFFHSAADRRRNPYVRGGFLYYLDSKCHCDNPNCPSYHSNYEYSYHPHVYKTAMCSRNPCEYQAIMCWMLHKGESFYFDQGEFFRFDIATFKTIKCTRTDQHQRKVCLGYHNEKDRRRPNFQMYSHIPCSKINCNCERSHNKIEQLYHPTRYKTKFCQHYNKDALACEYHDFCSFAHYKDQILIQLIDPDNKDPNYIVSAYKTVWCPYTQDHDRSECPYAHNIQDFRRKPSDYKYKAEKCPNWDFSNKIESIQSSKCTNGMSCNMCHGWMEHRFHPLIYKPKGAPKTYVKKEDILQKKLHNRKDSMKKQKERKIEVIINKEIDANNNKAAIFSVGAPFFKSQRESERDFSEASLQTKPKTGNHSNLGSEKSFNSNRVVARKGSIVERQPITGKISSVFFESQQHEIWECDSVQNAKERNSDGRSKSQGTSNQLQPSYSRSIKQFVNDNVLLDKLHRERVAQVSLINMNNKKVDNMQFLSKHEKDTLMRKLKEYELRNRFLNVNYSRKLTNFFSKNGADQLLTKLQQKRVKEHMMLKLSKQAIKEFSFLEEQEKDLLPRLLKKYGEAKEFETLMCEVSEWVNKPNHDAEER